MIAHRSGDLARHRSDGAVIDCRKLFDVLGRLQRFVVVHFGTGNYCRVAGKQRLRPQPSKGMENRGNVGPAAVDDCDGHVARLPLVLGNACPLRASAGRSARPRPLNKASTM